MKITFLGGGSYRVLPIVRGLLGARELHGCQIALFDTVQPRAEAMARMIRRCPEFAGSGAAVACHATAEPALAGADLVQIGFAVGDPGANRLSQLASWRHGFMASDNLSPLGSFLGMKAGPAILGYARQMERLCPDAWFLIFTNPVAVYSALVNNHTRVRALGVCGGYTNHMWDLPRLMGHDEFRPDFEVEVAGVNHLSFILRGRHRGRDLFAMLGEHLTPQWRPPRLTTEAHRHLRAHIRYALRRLHWLFNRFGTVIFSTEGDGMAHVFYEDMYERGRESRRRGRRPYNMRQAAAAGRAARERLDAEFATLAAGDRLPDGLWDSATQPDRRFHRLDEDATVRAARALAAGSGLDIVASHTNRGTAVRGFTDRTVLEYSQRLGRDGLCARGDLAVPPAFHGLIAGLAEHQTLLADAIATEDPRLLFQAFHAYPVFQNTRASRALFRELLVINADEISPRFQAARDYATAR